MIIRKNFALSFLIFNLAAAFSGCSTLKLDQQTFVLNEESFESKSISVTPHQNRPWSHSLAYEVSGILSQVGMEVVDGSDAKVLTMEVKTAESEGVSAEVTLEKTSTKVNYKNTDYVIDAFAPLSNSSHCVLRMFNRNTEKLMSSESFRCNPYHSRQPIIKALTSMNLLNKNKVPNDNKILYYEPTNRMPESPARLLNDDFYSASFVSLPFNLDDVFLEYALAVEGVLIELGARVEHLPAEAEKVRVYKGQGAISRNSLSQGGVKSFDYSQSLSTTFQKTNARYAFKTTPVVTLYGGALSYTVTLVDNLTGSVLSSSTFSSSHRVRDAVWMVLEKAGFSESNGARPNKKIKIKTKNKAEIEV